MSPRENINRASKFTRGEKCVFVHVIVTFVLILALVLVYFAHLLRAPHSAAAALRVARRSRVSAGAARVAGGGAALRAGLVRAGGRRVCASVLLRARWAAAPAHCVAARAHPDLAASLPAWEISYRLQNDLNFDSKIIRGVVHSHFNRDDFSNNIGLFEQAEPILIDEYKFDDTGVTGEPVRRPAHEASVVVWEADTDVPIGLPAHTVPAQRCRQVVAPVAEPRTYEFCLHAKNKNLTIEHGSVVFSGSKIKGFVAWGDKNGNLPLVILDIGFYQNWIENIINLY